MERQRDRKELVINNPMLVGVLIWQVVRSYYDETESQKGPELPIAFLAVSILFHKPSVATIKSMRMQSGIFKAISDDKVMRAGLQERLEGFADATFDGLNVAMSSGLLSLSRAGDAWPRLFPALRTKTLPKDLLPTGEGARDMLKSAKRLGAWFSSMDLAAIATIMRVVF